MNLNSFKNGRKALAIFLLPFVIYGLYSVYTQAHVNNVYAVDPLVITYSGGPPPNPMFTVTGMFPGDSSQKDFNVVNGSPDDVSVEMVANMVSEDKNFSNILDITIEDITDSITIYNGKLADLFNGSAIELGTFLSNDSKDFRITVTFPDSAGNEYQNASVTFNIVWRTAIPTNILPAECNSLTGKIDNVIYGTDKSENIYGTTGNDLIFALGGNDKVYAGGGDDCIVGGPGNDQLYGQNGNDIIVAGDGNDKVDGGNGNDLLYGGNGNDNIWGSNGNDKLYGNDGRDILHGGNGDDYLDGGNGFDVLFGNFGTDTCSGELKVSCEI